MRCFHTLYGTSIRVGLSVGFDDVEKSCVNGDVGMSYVNEIVLVDDCYNQAAVR